MIYNTLIDAESLHRQLGLREWVIIDCRFDLMNPDAGLHDYQQGHIPGALYAHLDEDLAGRVTETTGRHPLPAVSDLVARLEAWGISNESQVVVYDAAGGAIAARLWWMLLWLGHQKVAVLDGGIAAWLAISGRLEKNSPVPVHATFKPAPQDVLWMDSQAVMAAITDAALLIDARAPARFQGKVEPIDPVAGHVPGAVNYPFSENLSPEGKFLTPAELRQKFATFIPESDITKQTRIHMCGSGVTACHNILAMRIAQIPAGRLYVGSWSEWITDRNLPVACD